MAFNVKDAVSQFVNSKIGQIKNAFNPTVNNSMANKFWSGSGGNVLTSAQNFMENYKPTNYAERIKNPILRMPISMGESYFNTLTLRKPISAGVQIGKDIKTGAILNPQTYFADIAGAAEPILDVASLSPARKIASAFADNTLKASVKQGALQGLKYGSGYGLLSGLQQNKNTEYIPDYLKNVAGTTALGGGTGAVLGGVLSATGWSLTFKKKVADAIEKKWVITNPEEPTAYKSIKELVPFANGDITGGAITPEVKIVRRFLKNNPEYRVASEILNKPPVTTSEGFVKPSEFIPKGKAKFKTPQTQNLEQTLKQQGIQTPLSQETGLSEVPYKDIITPEGKPRGFVESVQEAQGVSKATKGSVEGTYTPKTNPKLMGEAKALMEEGASIDFKTVKNLDQKVAATIQEAINLDKKGNHDAAAALFNNLSEQGTELGRGVQAFSLLDRMSPEAISLSAAGKIKKFNATATRKIPELTGDQQKLISSTVESIRLMPEGREKNIALNELSQMVNDFIPSHIADKIITVWKAGLLTSLRTHERNLLGNTIQQGAEIVKDPIATVADKIMAQKTGVRTQTSTLKGLGEFGSAKTRQQVEDLVTRGYDPGREISKYEVNRVNWGNNPVEQALKKYTDTVFRVLGAEDRPFYNAAFARSMYDQAGAVAMNAGKQGDDVFIKSLVKSPTEQMLTTAVADANYATFHDPTKLSGLASAFKRGMGKGWGKLPAEVVAPFTGVPSSIVGKTIAYSPIGLVQGAVKMGRVLAGQVPELQRMAAQEVGRGVVGTGLFGLGAYLMSKGLMTGQPKDTAEAQQWQMENKPSNSVLVGGKWRSIGSIGPQNLVLLAGAKLNEELGKPEGNIGTYAMGLGKDQLSQTFLSGVQQPLAAVNDPARYGKSYVGNMAASTIPNIIKDASKALDPYARETNTFSDYLKSGIPGARNTLLPKRDVLGSVVPQEPTGVGAFTDLFNSKTPNTDPVVAELGRLYSVDAKAAPSKLNKNQTILGQKVVLTPQQLDQLEQQTGQPIKEQFGRLINTPEYQSASDDIKNKALDKIVSGVREQAKMNLATGTSGAGVVDVSKLTQQAQLTLAKDAFDKSGENFQVIGDTVLRRTSEGVIQAMPKVKFDYQVGTARLTQYKNEDNVDLWLKTAKGQLESIQKQLQDPSIDPLDMVQLQNDAHTLIDNIVKYSQYKGFTKPKAAKKITFKRTKVAKFKLKKLSLKMASNTGGSTFKGPVALNNSKLESLRNPKI
jgi:hypothetical protein